MFNNTKLYNHNIAKHSISLQLKKKRLAVIFFEKHKTLNYRSNEQNLAEKKLTAKFMMLLQSTVKWATAMCYSCMAWLED